MNNYYFTFEVTGYAADLFEVQYFQGQEGLSQLFYFDIDLKCTDVNFDSNGLVNQPAQFTFYFNNTPLRVIQGVINQFQESQYVEDGVLFKAKLVPKAWCLSSFESNEVYLDQTVEQTITTVLEEIGLTTSEFRFDLEKTYRTWPFRLQYSETHLNFMQRIIEREGIYYYFDSKEENSVLVFCDNLQSHQAVQSTPLTYQPANIRLTDHIDFVSSFICRQQSIPKKVILRDFNEALPSLDVRGEIEVDSQGVGEINIYGLNILTPEEGSQLCQIHANAYRCHKEQYILQSELATMASGLLFSLQCHPRLIFNESSYLIETIHHEGANLNAFQAVELSSIPVGYQNTVTACSNKFDYVSLKQASKPEINGTLNGIIDSETDGEYAELDEYGRYKIKLPFDRKDRDGGKASHWIRMIQPYGGTKEGMHFPLRKGTRVLLSFIGGDPDKPVIAGTISDLGEQSSLVNAENSTNSMIQTAAGNKIGIEDKQGKNRIKLQCPTNQTYLHLGAPNHDGSGFVLLTQGIERKDIQGGQRLTTQVLGEHATSSYTLTSQGQASDYSDIHQFQVIDHAGISIETLTTEMEISGDYLIERRCGPKYIFTDGNEHIYGGGDVYGFGNGYEEAHWREGENGGVHTDEVFNILGDSGEVFEQQEDGSWSRSYNKTIPGAQRFEPGDHQIEKVWSDTFSYQNGNNYAWGDTCDYEFGNGYAESHVETDDDGMPVNAINKTDWPYDLAIPKASEDNPHLVEVGAINGVYVKLDGGSTGVEKSIGNSYEYSHGKSVSVSYICDEEEHSYGGEKYEATYTKDGKLVGSEHKKNGVCTEIEQTPDGDFKEETISDVSGVGKVTTTNVYAYGSPVSYEIVREPAPGSTFSFKGDGLPTIEMKMEIDVGATEISTHIGGMSNSVEIEALGMKNEVSISGAIMTNTIELSGCPFETEIKTGDDGLEIKAWIGPLKTEMEARALKLKAEEGIKMETEVMYLLNRQLMLASHNADLTNSQLRLASSLLTILN